MVKPKRPISVRERFNISRLAIQYSWLTLSFWIAVAVAGVLAFSSLKYALFPDITFPVVVVNATAPLTTALDTETKLTKPIEQQLHSIEGLEEINSSTYPGQTAVSLSFAVGTNLEESTQKVKRAIKLLKLTNGAAFKIIPLNLNESAAISYVVESSSRNLTELTKLVQDQILSPIKKLPGVLKVDLLGDESASNQQIASSPTVPQEGATLIRFNGRDALAFQVIKRGDANTLDVVSKVEQQVQKLQSTLPDVRLSLAATQAEYIRKATQSTIDALIEAIALSVIVIFPFLRNWQATFISALAIPTSLLGTFIVMAIYGFNLETITLLALALVIGIIIDDAIVDVENIIRHVEDGEKPRQAALTATNEIGLTVTAATFTAVAVFLPIGLMGGVIGQFFKPFGITVSAAMLTSLLVARTLSPVLAIHWIRPKSSRHSHKDKKENLNQGFNLFYRHLLKWSLSHRKIVVALAVLSFVAGIGLIPLIPKGFIPKLDRGEFNIVYSAPLPNFQQQENLQSQPSINPLEDSLQVAKKLEEVVRKSPEVETVFTIVGSRQGEPNKGKLYVKLKNDRKIKTSEVQDKLRSSLPSLAGVTTSVEDIQFVDDSGGQKPLQIALKGNDLNSLSKAANAIKARITKMPGFADVTVTGVANSQANVVEIDRHNNQRVVYVSANLGKDISLGNATDKLVAEAKAVLPPGVSLDLGGDSGRSSDVFSSFGTTLCLSVLCILAVLIGLFKSWIDPLVIVISLPLALVGAMLSLLVTKSDFGMISLIGFVFLLGLSNKNAILLVDYINQLRKSGLNRTEAILKAAPVRLRPIMMTTAATILGMVPIALGLGAGSELRSPMAVAIAGGLVSSTVLSLIVVPVIYTILDDWFPRKK
ncbi:efflux RND transporter permease subunit [Aetokthonos hydrillicola Thurmond2011]|uniref:Efflux RND transporter permease subunit n=3 Tax=Aetokthonos TaxID=1550243 RepID=A0AAP5I3D8_9CYAN|nr:efflux RND transporter permease subunit [Aetokthonos hydrillicola]MBO3459277.1 efflux RND transporter permease subunit [Aetokthonos hydrillicola CCALA 1050]MBW4590587.1 efflux RND transporter permease subunit [Aetokthonos hydrillicola CCALA 1050]MDR9894352.1 efflux RND transporter permease subunit [Aetokthonos hydrillicola Thurmond2011]